MEKFRLKLFITGQTSRSSRAITNLRRICNDELGTEFELTIIDVLEKPQLAEDDRVIATPTLIREFPPPIRRIIGDLSNTKLVLQALELLHKLNQEEK